MMSQIHDLEEGSSGIVTIGIAKPLPCSTVVGGEKANGQSIQSSQKLEYFTKILRLIMSLHRDIMQLHLQCSHNLPEAQQYRVPKIKAEIAMQ
ncbi:unnamed protein product [Chrysodeixis includens]|uniref:Uncharacterized protein n=1 Tax=Chrysodeixis includens TaxID=689277 RepID=A0A9P0BW89_CHRIL|nr:unnamed protein product [Chrysodeixis includens]